MIKSKFKYTLLGTIGILFASFAVFTAQAADNIAGLIVSPPTSEQEVAPGDTLTGKVKITNPNSTTSLSVAISVEDFMASGEDGGQTFADPDTNNNSYSLGKWITTETQVELSANESKEVNYTVKVPENAEPGGHYGVIFFSPSVKATEGVSGSGVVAVPKVGALLLLNVPGDIQYKGSIVEFITDKKLYIENTNLVKFLSRFQNMGSTHVKPQGSIVVKNIFGKEVASLKVNDKQGNVLPDSIRKFENEWQKKWGFGPYKAQLNLNFGENSSVISALTFWIIPWQIILTIIVILIILIWIFRHLKWNNKNQTPPPVNNPQTTVPPTNNPPSSNI